MVQTRVPTNGSVGLPYFKTSSQNSEWRYDTDTTSIKKFKSYKEKCVFVDCNTDKDLIADRIFSINQRLEEPDVSADEVKVLFRRKMRMTSGVAIIYVGGSTESEVKERRDRVDDAVNATRVAMEEGIIPGGGSAMLRASYEIEKKSNDIGYVIMSNALRMPLYQIAKNSGDIPEIILEKLKNTKNNTGYNAYTGKITNLMKDGVIDPVKVTVSALENATSAALNLLSVGCAAVVHKENQNVE